MPERLLLAEGIKSESTHSDSLSASCVLGTQRFKIDHPGDFGRRGRNVTRYESDERGKQIAETLSVRNNNSFVEEGIEKAPARR